MDFSKSKHPKPVVRKVVRKVPVGGLRPGQVGNPLPASRSPPAPPVPAKAATNTPAPSVPVPAANNQPSPAKPLPSLQTAMAQQRLRGFNKNPRTKPRVPTPGSISKSPPPKESSAHSLSAQKSLRDNLIGLYFQQHTQTHPSATNARKHGVSPKDIEQFDVTTLYGAHENALPRLHARLNPPDSPHQPLSPSHAGFGPSYDFDDEVGVEFTWGEMLPNPFPDPTPPAAPVRPSLVVTLPIPQGFRPVAAPPVPVAPVRRPANRPSTPPGIPANAVYAMGTRAIPPGVAATVAEVHRLAALKLNKASFPQTVDLRTLPAGLMGFDRRYGYISRNSELYGFFGDLRLFSAAWWDDLVSRG